MERTLVDPQTAIVIDSGHENTHVIPIYTGILSQSFFRYLICLFLGYALQYATMKFDVAGIELTNYIIQLFRLRSDTTFLKFS